MSSRFLRQSIATLLSLGALWGGGDLSAANASTVNVTCHNFSCVPEYPWDPDWGGGIGGGGGGSGGWDTSGGGGGGGGEPECPPAPGGNSLIPSLKSSSCPAVTCEQLLPNKPCASRVDRPSSWDDGRDAVRAGSPIARMIALADPNSPSGAVLLPEVRGNIQAALIGFNQAGPFVSLDDSRRNLSNTLSQACSMQRQYGVGMSSGWSTCADVAVDIGREAIGDPGFLRFFLDQIAQQGFGIDPARYGPISWVPGSNSLAAHHANIDKQHICAAWWEQVDRLQCGVP